MKPFTAKTILTALIFFAAPGGYALANPIYFDFASQMYPTPNTGQTSLFGNVDFTPTSTATTGSAIIDPMSGTHVAGSGNINIANMVWQVAPGSPDNPGLNGTPSTFNPQPFKLALTLTDEASHAQGTFHFQGTFGGTPGWYPQGPLSFAPGIQTLVLGHNSYTVDLSQQTSWISDPSGGWMMMAAYGNNYDVPAQLTVKPLPVQSAPEPTSLTLAALGLVSVLGSRLRREPR